jgi:hypothetical protein
MLYVRLGRLGGVVARMVMMAVSHGGVVRGLLVVALLVVLCGLLVVLGGLAMMLCGFAVVVGGMLGHWTLLSWKPGWQRRPS